MTEQKVEVKEVPSISDSDMKILAEAKELKAKQERFAEMKELFNDPSFKEQVRGMEVKEEVLANKEIEQKEVKDEPLEIKEYRAMFKEGANVSLDEKFRRAGLLAEKMGMISFDGVDGLKFKQSSEKTNSSGLDFKQFGTNGTAMEFKGLSITSNQNTDTDYLLSAAELRDVFDPVIYDVLNQSTKTWNYLQKDDYSNKGNNQVQFVIRNGTNSTAAFYTGNSVSTDNSALIKLQTKFKKVQAGVAVDGDMIASSRGGPIGDVFAQHVRFATEDMLAVVNTALYAEVGLETASAIIGFEYIADSAGNTTLYNMTRTSVVGLEPTGFSGGAATDTYINGSSARISLDNLRLAIEKSKVRGSDEMDLVFFTHPTQERLFKGLFDASQLLTMVANPRFGFEGRLHFDGVPIVTDTSCNSDDWFLVNVKHHRIGIWVPPTLEMLGKRSDSSEGFVKMYLATYNTNPCTLVMIYGNATS